MNNRIGGGGDGGEGKWEGEVASQVVDGQIVINGLVCGV